MVVQNVQDIDDDKMMIMGVMIYTYLVVEVVVVVLVLAEDCVNKII